MTIAYFIKGLPGIGKTKYSYTFSKGAVYNNMDTLRRMYPHYKENQIKQQAFCLTEMAIKNKLDIVLDNTYMFKDYKESKDYQLLKEAGYDIRDINMNNRYEDTVKTAVENNANRPNRVPEHIIHRMAFSGHLPNDYLVGKKVFIVDIDGTLYDIRKRLSLSKAEDKINRKWFFDPQMIRNNDIFRPEVWDMVDKDAVIIIVSGRKDSTASITEDMLLENGVKYDHIFMRYNYDHRDDTKVKEDILDILVSKGLDVSLTTAIDDRKRILDMRGRRGIKAINVSLEEDNDF